MRFPKSSHKKVISFFITIFSIVGYGAFVFAAQLADGTPPPTGGYLAGDTILDPGCGPRTTDCFQNIDGWSLFGNAGTDGGGTNFIGTLDAKDFVIRTDNEQSARFGFSGEIALGKKFEADEIFIGSPNLDLPLATGVASIAIGSGSEASGIGAVAIGLGSGSYHNLASGILSFAIGIRNTTSAQNNFAFGEDNLVDAVGGDSYAIGEENEVQSVLGDAYAFGINNHVHGESAFSIGRDSNAYGAHSYAIGLSAVADDDYEMMLGSNYLDLRGPGSGFVFNDNDFTWGGLAEENKFYFDYATQAIRMGSVSGTEWEGVNVGERSIALGFTSSTFSLPGPISSGTNAFAVGPGSTSSGMVSTTMGLANTASGVGSVAIGIGNTASDNGAFALGINNTASGNSGIVLGQTSTASGPFSLALGYNALSSGTRSVAIGRATASGWDSFAVNTDGGSTSNTITSGERAIAIGHHIEASSFSETVFGYSNTLYTPVSVNGANDSDRLFTIGNGSGGGFESDAFTILKNGQVGIAIDNFEANNTGYVFEIGDGGSNVLAYFDNIGLNWMTVSDERKKHNIEDLSYGLDQILALRPVSFNYNFNNQHTIGFLAQQALPIVPESVGGSDSEGYSMSYTTIVPVLVKAIQELNLKVESINDIAGGYRSSLISWLADASNGIGTIISQKMATRTICVFDDQGQTCLNRQQIDALLNNNNGQLQSQPPTTPPPTPTPGPGPDSDPDSTTGGDTGTPTDQSGDGSTDTQTPDSGASPDATPPESQ